MSVQIVNAQLGVRRVDHGAVDAHGAPLPGQGGEPSALMPGKVQELESGGWQLALDPGLWPVRVGDRIVSDDGREWVATSSKFIGTPELDVEEQALGLDLDISFVRVMGNQSTPNGTEPGGGEFVGRVGYPG